MADRLQVDYDVLEMSASSLARIGHEFEDATSSKNSLEGALGSGSIADAMDEFVGNWDRHRRQVIDAMHQVEGTTRSAMASFREADRRTGQSLRTQGSPTSPGGPR